MKQSNPISTLQQSKTPESTPERLQVRWSQMAASLPTTQVSRSLERIESREYSEEDERWREYARMERLRNDE